MSHFNDEHFKLNIGWKADAEGHPKYWLRGEASAGRQTPSDDLIQVLTKKAGAHTAIVAQSGSGKSFFLGHLLEELVLKTNSRLLVLDPNADYSCFHELRASSNWSEAKYNIDNHEGWLPDEPSLDSIQKKWHSKAINIFTTRTMEGENYKKLVVSWALLPPELLANDVDSILRSEVWQCHNFVKGMWQLRSMKRCLLKDEDNATERLLDQAEFLLNIARAVTKDFSDYLRGRFDVKKWMNRIEENQLPVNMNNAFQALTGRSFPRRWSDTAVVEDNRKILLHAVNDTLDKLIERSSSISKHASKYYFARARVREGTGVFDYGFNQTMDAHLGRSMDDVNIIDLPSIDDKETRLLTVSVILRIEWERARRAWEDALDKPAGEDTRIPTFVVVDEAHNLIPAETDNPGEIAVREQFRAIVSEGRKYGLFLIMATQRPDKVDSHVLSECENNVLMKLSSKSVLEKTCTLMGLDDPEMIKRLEKCLKFKRGRFCLAGSWAGEMIESGYGIARRTREGGRNLRAEHWACPSSDS